MPFLFTEVVKIIELGPYEVHKPKGAESLKFRVEIIRRNKTPKFFARIYRSETFRIQPSFPQLKGKPSKANIADCEVLVLDSFFETDKLQGKSQSEVLKKLEAAFDETFST
jgi:hypothetical protein